MISLMWNLRKNTHGHMGGDKKREGNTPEETLKDKEQTQGSWREVGGGWAKWVIGIKESICYVEQWVIYK